MPHWKKNGNMGLNSAHGGLTKGILVLQGENKKKLLQGAKK